MPMGRKRAFASKRSRLEITLLGVVCGLAIGMVIAAIACVIVLFSAMGDALWVPDSEINRPAMPAQTIAPTPTPLPTATPEPTEVPITAAEVLFGVQSASQQQTHNVQPFPTMESLAGEASAQQNRSVGASMALGIGTQRRAEDEDFDRTVFVGDESALILGNYVQRQRQTHSNTLGSAKFFVQEGLTVDGLLEPVSEASIHPVFQGTKMTLEDAIARMGASCVVLMLGRDDIPAIGAQTAAAELMVLVGRIRAVNPQINIAVAGLTPRMASNLTEPDNETLMQFNTALADRCARESIAMIDIGSPLRDSEGALPESRCLDPEGTGTRLNNAGNAIVLEYIYTHWPWS